VDLQDSDTEVSFATAAQAKSGESGCPSDKRKTKDALPMTLARIKQPSASSMVLFHNVINIPVMLNKFASIHQ
ncbi:hypothetical protein Tco_1127109, partial [Tanacetum coccineum]